MVDQKVTEQKKQPEQRKQHKMLSASISEIHKPIYDKFVTIAQKLNCRLADLVWFAVEQIVAKPPTTPPVSSSPATGSAHGFWVVHRLNDTGKLVAISIVESIRYQIAGPSGRLFFRYEEGESKSRANALVKAQRTALYDAQLTGITVPSGGFQISSLLDK